MRFVVISALFFLVASCTQKVAEGNKYFVELQLDHFIKTNSCGQSFENIMNVIAINFPVDRKIADKATLEISVTEKNSQNQQTVIYREGQFFYPGLFGKKEHKEFNKPVCKGEICEFEVYIFTQDWKPLSNELDIQVNVSSGSKVLLEHQYDSMKNFFSLQRERLIPRMLLSHDAATQEVLLVIKSHEMERIKHLKPEDMEIAFQWKPVGPADPYLEESHKFEPSWLQGDIEIKHKLPITKYVAAMLMYRIDGSSYEMKLEIKNDDDGFYNCKK